MQLAGHLKGQARQEWNLINTDGVEESIEILRSRLDPGNKALAAQDFCYATQEDKEEVSDFIVELRKVLWTGHHALRDKGCITVCSITRRIML